MDLILWRHAEAENAHGQPDSERQLTQRGREQAERTARWLRPLLKDGTRILCSPARRTLQTVAPLERDFEESQAVGLEATADTVLRAAGWPEGSDDVLVVGHQPTLGEVVARLLAESADDIDFRKGAVWWFTTLRRGGQLSASLKAVVDPDGLDE
jgi:phosphohistidine phosphatase